MRKRDLAKCFETKWWHRSKLPCPPPPTTAEQLEAMNLTTVLQDYKAGVISEDTAKHHLYVCVKAHMIEDLLKGLTY